MSVRRLFAAAPAALLLLSACAGGDTFSGWGGTITDSAGVRMVQNPVEGVWAPGEAWTVEEVLSVGAIDAAADYQFGQITGADVDTDGNVYVADIQTSDIRVFDAQGAYLRTIGKPGAGPGEFGRALMGVFVVGDTVLAIDLGNVRVARFLRDGTFLDSERLDPTKGQPVRWDVAGNGRLVMQNRYFNPADSTSKPRGDAVVTWAGPDDPVDTLAVLPVGQSAQMVNGRPEIRMFAPEPIWDAAPDGRMVTGMTNEWRFQVWNADGTLARVFSRPSETKAVTERDQTVVKNAIKQRLLSLGANPAAVEQVLQQYQFADTYPTFALIALGPRGSVWVQNVHSGSELAGEDGETFDPQDLGSTEWGVFDAEGRYMGSVTFPGKYQPIRTVGDLFYGIARDEMDVQSLKVFRVVMN